jgi:hypothetical protein
MTITNKKEEKSMHKQNQNDDLIGLKKITARNAHCYRVTGRRMTMRRREILHEGTPIVCGKTMSMRNGHGTTLFVETNIKDPSTEQKLWVKQADLGELAGCSAY